MSLIIVNSISYSKEYCPTLEIPTQDGGDLNNTLNDTNSTNSTDSEDVVIPLEYFS